MAYLLIPIVIAAGIAQLAIGYMGLEFMIGTWAAIVGLILAFGLRLMLPMTIGSYFGAVDVLGWPWWAGVIVVAPGLLFIVPAMVTSLAQRATGK